MVIGGVKRVIVDDMGNPVGYSTEERQQALTVSLCSIASHLGYTPFRSGRHYSLKEMDSLIIYNDRTWNRWSGKGNITGGTQIDFLMAFGEIDTPQQAIKWLLNFKGSPAELNYMKHNPIIPDEQPKHNNMILPPRNANYRRLFAYLIQTRGLSAEVVSDFVHRKLIYEDSVHHNIVFCGYDMNGNIRYAGMRGTADRYGKKFKMDVPGNDKNYGVNIVRKESTELKVFESVIDCMSYIDIYNDYSSNMIILGMVDDHPLMRFLQDYKHIKRISFCLDNDKAGQGAIYDGKKLKSGEYKPGLKEKYENLGYEVKVELPPTGKDFNESLLEQKGMIKILEEQKEESHKSEVKLSYHKDNKSYVSEFYEKMLNMCGYAKQDIIPGEEMATVKYTNSTGRTYLSDGYGDCARWLMEDSNLASDVKEAVEQYDKKTRKIHLLKENDKITEFYIADNSDDIFSLVDENGFKYTEKNMHQLYLDFDGIMTAREMDNLKTLCILVNDKNTQLSNCEKNRQEKDVQKAYTVPNTGENVPKTLKITLDIPKEYVKDFKTDKFHNFWEHIMSVMDDNGSFDNNEKQIAGMFCQAFEDASAVEEKAEEQKNIPQPVYRRGGHR